MSNFIPTMFFLTVFQDEQPGSQFKVHTSAGSLLTFLESLEWDKSGEFPVDWGPTETFVLNTEDCSMSRYDTAPLKSLAMKPKEKLKSARPAKKGAA